MADIEVDLCLVTIRRCHTSLQTSAHLVRDTWSLARSFGHLGEVEEGDGKKGEESDDELLKDSHCGCWVKDLVASEE